MTEELTPHQKQIKACQPGSSGFTSCMYEATKKVYANWRKQSVHDNEVALAHRAAMNWIQFRTRAAHMLADDYFVGIPADVLREMLHHPRHGPELEIALAHAGLSMPDALADCL